ncbi:MAG: translation elongation factor Ts [Candidatus Schekmanbacteria bacterium]|nr:MAG: translation elongation factor Ts [Candidatus Schekmanbacteria bacterium]
MSISAESVKSLREKTGAGILDCKEALQSTNGDFEKAIEYLRKKGIAAAQKRSSRATSAGSIGSYIHAGGKIGVLIEVNCETDFVAKTDDFQELVKNLSMQVAAANPKYVSRDDVPQEEIEREKEIYISQAKDSGKPEKVLEKIAAGKLEKFYESVCLMEQSYIKDADKSVKDLVDSVIAKVGENITVKRFVRFQLGEN